MKIVCKFLVFISFTAITCACARRHAAAGDDRQSLYEPEYASGFALHSCGEGAVLTVRNPWQGAQGVEIEYYLDPTGEGAPDGFAGTVISVPLKRVVCMSSSYVAFIDALGGTEIVKGVSGADFISNAQIREGYASGMVKDVGYDTNLDYEAIAVLRPDVVMIYGVAGENAAISGKLGEMGIKTMYIGDYTEQSPLGKAEWLIAFGELLGKREKAEEFFAGVRDSYTATLEKVEQIYTQHVMLSSSGRIRNTRVMLNAPWRDVWFVPGDRSYMVRLINDAGGEYVCAGEDTDVSRPISTETAFVYASKADAWLNPGGQANTLAELKALDARFADVPSVRKGRVFNCNRRRTSAGGSDFWESGAVRPDLVLLDIASLLHPGHFPDHELYYYEVLE